MRFALTLPRKRNEQGSFSDCINIMMADMTIRLESTGPVVNQYEVPSSKKCFSSLRWEVM